MDGAEAQTRAGRPDPERPADKVDVLSTNELRLSSSFLSRHLNARAEVAVRGRPIEPKS
jgi:hypothetical protein